MNDINFPILEWDEDKTAILEPHEHIKVRGAPDHCVICFFREVIDAVIQQTEHEIVWRSDSEARVHTVYQITHNGTRLALFHPPGGASLSAALLEGLVAIGCKKFIVCGGAGIIGNTTHFGHLYVPTAAIRDEGTSYHYLPPSREVEANAKAISAVEATLMDQNIPYELCKTWTTDGFYRETRARLKQRLAEGCATVEMEAAALFSVAHFRNVPLGYLLYGGDDLSGDNWNDRGWGEKSNHISLRETVFWLAADSCVQL